MNQEVGHGEVSSVAGEAAAPTPDIATDQVTADFVGEPKTGELEFLPGFDPSRALSEGTPHQFVTDELGELRPVEEAPSEA